MIGKKLYSPAVLPENIYNIDKTEVILSISNSVKVLVGKDNIYSGSSRRGACVKRTIATVIEYVSADSRCLNLIIILPALTYCAN